MTLNKAPWSAAEDELLTTIIKEKGPQHWKEIALELGKRSNYGIFRQGKQCRERWINHLDPHIKKGAWTEEEDVALLTLFLERGKKWAEIAKKLGGRTENNVKNRWISLMRKYKSEFNAEGGIEDFEGDEMSNWEEKTARAVIKLRGQEISSKIPSEINLNFNNSVQGSEMSSQFLSKSDDGDENLHANKNYPEKAAIHSKRVDKALPDLNGNLPSKDSLKQKLAKVSGAMGSFQKPMNGPINEFYLDPNNHYDHHNPHPTAATYGSLNGNFKKEEPVFPRSGLPLSMMGNQPMLQVKIPQQFHFHPSHVPIHPQMNSYNPQVTVNKDFKEINSTIQQNVMGNLKQSPYPTSNNHPLHIQSSTICQTEVPQIQSSGNLLEESELFHLSEKKIEKIPLEAQPDKDYLYFAVIDTKTHEIYIMNQVTPANYGQTLNALSADKFEEFASNSMQIPADFPLSQEPDFPEYPYSRRASDFFYDDK